MNGRTLTYWIDQFDRDVSSESPEVIQSALSAMDDRCVRALIGELNRNPSPSPIWTAISDWVHRWNRSAAPIRESPYRGANAALVLGHLGSRATNAIPALENASRIRMRFPEEGADIRGASLAALVLIRRDSVQVLAKKSLAVADPYSGDYRHAIYCLGTNAAPAIPVFVDALDPATNYHVKYYAAHSLVSIHRPDLSLPPLVSMLKEPNNISRSIAISSLEGFRDEAKPAWNDLVVLLNDPEVEIRRRTTNALWFIDPVAAQQLGITLSP